MKIYFIILIGFLFSACSNCFEDEFDKIEFKYNCRNVDDCLSAYEFDGARAFLSKMVETEKTTTCNDFHIPSDFASVKSSILIAESNYFVDQQEYSRALSTLQEATPKDYGWLMGEQEKDKAIRNLLDKIVSKLLADEDYKMAKKYAFKASEDRDRDGYVKPSTGFSDGRREDWKSHQDYLLDKIKKYKKEFVK